MREWGYKSAQRTPAKIFVKTLYNFKKEDVCSLIKQIEIPTLLLYGDMKESVLEGIEKMKNIIPGSKLYIFRNTGPCFINMFAANKFNKILETFINSGELIEQKENRS